MLTPKEELDYVDHLMQQPHFNPTHTALDGDGYRVFMSCERNEPKWDMFGKEWGPGDLGLYQGGFHTGRKMKPLQSELSLQFFEMYYWYLVETVVTSQEHVEPEPGLPEPLSPKQAISLYSIPTDPTEAFVAGWEAARNESHRLNAIIRRPKARLSHEEPPKSAGDEEI